MVLVDGYDKSLECATGELRITFIEDSFEMQESIAFTLVSSNGLVVAIIPADGLVTGMLVVAPIIPFSGLVASIAPNETLFAGIIGSTIKVSSNETVISLPLSEPPRASQYLHSVRMELWQPVRQPLLLMNLMLEVIQ